MMKVIIALAAVLAVVLAAPTEDDTYDSKYDNFNAQEIAENLRLLKAYGNCFLDEGPCTAEGHDFKKVMPEAVKTECAKCSPKQKELIRIIVRAFQKELPDIWEKLVDKQDPKREYKQAFDNFINGN